MVLEEGEVKNREELCIDLGRRVCSSREPGEEVHPPGTSPRRGSRTGGVSSLGSTFPKRFGRDPLSDFPTATDRVAPGY